jgi:hypothetical protein
MGPDLLPPNFVLRVWLITVFLMSYTVFAQYRLPVKIKKTGYATLHNRF